MAQLIGYLSEGEQLQGRLSDPDRLVGELSMPVFLGGGLSEEVKQALLDLFAHLAYTDADGQDYYDALYNAFYPPAELTSISAVYTQSGAVFEDTPLEDLEDDLVVTAHYSNGTTEEVTTYTLSGTLTAGTSVVTVTYEDKTTTFNVTVSAPATLSSITAVYTQSGVVYPTDSLDSLKSDLVVTAHYSDSSTATVTTYTLSGTLTVGTSTITVSYGGKTTTFNVTVTAVPVLSSITAVYTQSGTVYDTDSLDSLKADLVVTAVYTDSSTEVVPSADYTLSGSMTHGTNTITVSYENKTTTFTVTVSEHWTYNIDDLTRASGAMVSAAAADCGTALAETTANRYSFFRDSGKTPAAIQRNNAIYSQTSDYYPVKVPQGATALTVTITPSTQYVAAYPRKLNDGKYETWAMTTGSSSYTAHETSFTFDAADDNCYIFMTTKYNNAGTSYPTAPTGLDIVFS